MVIINSVNDCLISNDDIYIFLSVIEERSGASWFIELTTISKLVLIMIDRYCSRTTSYTNR